ncbi:hypothetical protein HX065_15335 [Myroides odoratimimus]|uniref:hypothetical protein n=1 Tax=Myroides odoratimimus TaxID=76832 RepID=UPI0025782C22|nr:hypothetical protein [Myroides odoratimimus]MDM1461394.1 hypothetical protein [Myroides odoratimimus]
MEKLNDFFVDFLSNIQTSQPNSRFRLTTYCGQDFIEIINNSPVLKKKLISFFSSFKVLDEQAKNEFNSMVTKSQDIEKFFKDDTITVSDTMSDRIIEILGNRSFNILVNHLFKVTLKSFGIKNHYTAIYDNMPHKVCPFCGVEKMHKSFQEDYDHLAAKKHYPIVAIHMKNLAPMCHTCNSKNKGENDVLHNNDMTRRTFVYPYSNTCAVTINFDNCIIPQTNPNTPAGSWDISFLPQNSITTNWASVFGIKKRYKEDYLEANFEEWLEEFVDGLIYSGININTEQEVIDQLSRWSIDLRGKKFLNTNFIKAPLFEFLSICGIDIFYQSLIVRFNQKVAA